MPRKNRKARKELAKKNLDLTKPITLEQLGSGEDPCFGKHYDPRAAECNRCGDSELCAIALAQNNHINRLKVEKKMPMKDVEEGDIKKMNPKKLRKEVKAKIREIVRDHKNGIASEVLIENVYGIYNAVDIKKSLIKKLITKLESLNKITFKDGKYKIK